MPFIPGYGSYYAVSNGVPIDEFDLSLAYYLAGPMSGLPEYNYPRFDQACALLRNEGLEILSPHEVLRPGNHVEMQKEALWEYMMGETRELLERAGGIILLPGWYTSRGALAELSIVREYKLPTWFFNPSTCQASPMWNRD